MSIFLLKCKLLPLGRRTRGKAPIRRVHEALFVRKDSNFGHSSASIYQGSRRDYSSRSIPGWQYNGFLFENFENIFRYEFFIYNNFKNKFFKPINCTKLIALFAIIFTPGIFNAEFRWFIFLLKKEKFIFSLILSL